MPKKQKKVDADADKERIETGMVVEATKGDLGEEDVSKPKVSAVTRDKDGEIEELTVQKGVIFKKTLDIPAERIQSIEQKKRGQKNAGKVIVDISKEEAASLTAVGEEVLSSDKEKGLLDTLEQEVPTAEGLRELEASNSAMREKRNLLKTLKGKQRHPVQKIPLQLARKMMSSLPGKGSEEISSSAC